MKTKLAISHLILLRLFLILACVLFIYGCDLSSLIGGKTNKSSPTSTPASPYVQSYVINTAGNPAITVAVTGLLANKDIYILLPYTVVNNQTPLTPTVTMQSGYTFNTSGAFVQGNGMTLLCTKTADSSVYSLTLHVSVDPTTIPAQGTSYIQTYVLTAAQSAGALTSDVTGVVTGNNIYILLPYSVLNNSAKLTPTVAMQTGYTFNTVGAFVQTDGMTLAVTQTSNQSVYNFTLHVGVNPSTVPAQQTNYVQSYLINVAQNPSLPTNVTAVITGTNIYITLPYNTIQTQTALLPTVTMQPGYTIGITGAFIHTDGMTLVVTKTSDTSVSLYTLHVAVDPASIAFLKLSNPYYIDTDGIKQDITANTTLTLNSANNTYTLTLVTNDFSMNYVATSVQAILARPIGFLTAAIPYGAFGNTGPATAGTVPPYTIQVQSPNRSVTNTFTITAVRTLSSSTQFTDAAAIISYIYTYTVTRGFADATVTNFLNTDFNPLDTTGSVYYHQDDYGAVDHYTYRQAFSTPYNGELFPLVFSTPNATVNAQVAAWNGGAIGSEGAGTTTIGTTSPDFGKNWTLSGTVSAPAQPNGALAPTGGSFNVTAICQDTYTYNPTYTCNFPISRTAVYTGVSYCQWNTIIMKIPTYITVTSMIPSSSVQTWNRTTSADGKDWVYTLIMVPTYNHVTGPIATFVLKAEDGTSTTYYPTLT